MAYRYKPGKSSWQKERQNRGHFRRSRLECQIVYIRQYNILLALQMERKSGSIDDRRLSDHLFSSSARASTAVQSLAYRRVRSETTDRTGETEKNDAITVKEAFDYRENHYCIESQVRADESRWKSMCRLDA